MKKKIFSLCLVVALVATAVVGGTLAYFTDTTETATNTFKIGDVDITLDEPAWTLNDSHTLMPGKTFAKDPTITVAKDSQDCWVFMKVEVNKFNAWLRLVGIQNGFVVVDPNCRNENGTCQGHINATKFEEFFKSGAYKDAFDEWFGGVNHDIWQIMNLDEVMNTIVASWNDKSIKTVAPIFGYKTALKANDKVTLFNSVTMPATVTTKQLEDSRFNTEKKDWELKITAYAIQKEQIETLDDAYDAMFNKK